MEKASTGKGPGVVQIGAAYKAIQITFMTGRDSQILDGGYSLNFVPGFVILKHDEIDTQVYRADDVKSIYAVPY